MGILSAFLNSMNKNIAETLWPEYQSALRNPAITLKGFIHNETNNIKKSVYLLALAQKDRYMAAEIYKGNKTGFNNGLNCLKAYRKFQPEVEMFLRRMADSVGSY